MERQREGERGKLPGPLQPASQRFVIARGQATVSRAGTTALHLVPTALGRALIAHHAYRPTYRPWVSLLPPYASQRNVGYYGLHIGSYQTLPKAHFS